MSSRAHFESYARYVKQFLLEVESGVNAKLYVTEMNSRKASASTRKILVQLSTYYEKAADKSKCTPRQESRI
ncbi:hypothetical protein M7I_0675 [Glarea lozoyensis 74030]|uniref:Uncharacterized protein n=1 Tax=Glarea lozoyensis (strain ATCC 74030 / MF5533) TaxID=1104152 RepID=H0EE07_GLAL7|nr:hypothetical protein M7I_0675 [Glarea lozoyensis 74030]